MRLFRHFLCESQYHARPLIGSGRLNNVRNFARAIRALPKYAVDRIAPVFDCRGRHSGLVGRARSIFSRFGAVWDEFPAFRREAEIAASLLYLCAGAGGLCGGQEYDAVGIGGAERKLASTRRHGFEFGGCRRAGKLVSEPVAGVAG